MIDRTRSALRVSSWLCQVLGHKWVWPGEMRYEQGRAMAYVGHDSEMQEVDVTWICDEVCVRCGGETWWPS